jgi:hypothetical protein
VSLTNSWTGLYAADSQSKTNKDARFDPIGKEPPRREVVVELPAPSRLKNLHRKEPLVSAPKPGPEIVMEDVPPAPRPEPVKEVAPPKNDGVLPRDVARGKDKPKDRPRWNNENQPPKRKFGHGDPEIEMRDHDEDRRPNQTPSSYCYTSDLQNRVSPRNLLSKILEQTVQLQVGDVLGASIDLTRELNKASKTRREYNTVASRITQVESNDEDEESEGDDTRGRPTYRVQPPRSSSPDFIHRFSGAIAQNRPRFYAMSTGKITGQLGHEEGGDFMVDTGSELNIITRTAQEVLNLPLDPDGRRWSLRGINGEPIALLGCCRNVPIEIGGIRFDHHFFVSAKDLGKHDAILGQPWLEWVSAKIDYRRGKGMVIRCFENGDTDGRSIEISATSNTNPRNQDKLVHEGSYERDMDIGEYERMIGLKELWNSDQNVEMSPFAAEGGEVIPLVGEPDEEVYPVLGEIVRACADEKDEYVDSIRDEQILLLSDNDHPLEDGVIIYAAEMMAKESGHEDLNQWMRKGMVEIDEPGDNRVAWGLCTRVWSQDMGKVFRALVGKKKYKPVSKKVIPVSTQNPDHSAPSYKDIHVPPRERLPTYPRPLHQFESTGRLTQERLEMILKNQPKGFLSDDELALMVEVLARNNRALAFDDSERGTFSREHFPDYVMPTIPHVPWNQPPIRPPKAFAEKMAKMLREQMEAGKYEYSNASYRSRVFGVLKKDDSIRLVFDLQPLNAVTIRDSGLPPRVDDFAESFVGRSVYGIYDLFSGYDECILAEESRNLTTFHSVIGPLRLTSLPQGYTNSMPEFQRRTSHILKKETPEHAGVFIDDIGVKGPTSRYNEAKIPGNPNIRKFIYEFATTTDRVLATLGIAGATASGYKIVLATPIIHIVGNLCSLEGRKISHGIVSKVLNWPTCVNTSDVRGFLGTANCGRNWIRNYSIVAKPLTHLLKGSPDDFEWDELAQKSMDSLTSHLDSPSAEQSRYSPCDGRSRTTGE